MESGFRDDNWHAAFGLQVEGKLWILECRPALGGNASSMNDEPGFRETL